MPALQKVNYEHSETSTLEARTFCLLFTTTVRRVALRASELVTMFSKTIIKIIKSTCFSYYQCYPLKANLGQLLGRRLFGSKTDSTTLEIGSGAGGSEAMLFAEDMLNIYIKYFVHKNWPYRLMELEKAGSDGVRIAKLLVNAPGSFDGLVQEAGVHRVQRVPKTEKYGRIHTSTITVSVLPESILNIKIDDRDVEWQSKRASGPGGQHVNKTESAVRLIHKPTGVAVESQESRVQQDNRKTAMKKLLKKIQEIELDKITSQALRMKRSQVGHADRNEKIRTYNFPQDRITDHRLGKSYHGLKSLFTSNQVQVLEKMIQEFHQ